MDQTEADEMHEKLAEAIASGSFFSYIRDDFLDLLEKMDYIADYSKDVAKMFNEYNVSKEALDFLFKKTLFSDFINAIVDTVDSFGNVLTMLKKSPPRELLMKIKDVEAKEERADFVKDMGSLPLPAEVIGEITERAYRVDKEWLGNIWFNLGKKLGTYMHAYVSDIREIENHSKQIIRFVPIKLVKIESKTENSLTITIIGSWTSGSLSYCIGQTLNGMMETYSYKMKNLRFGSGFLVALFETDLKA